MDKLVGEIEEAVSAVDGICARAGAMEERVEKLSLLSRAAAELYREAEMEKTREAEWVMEEMELFYYRRMKGREDELEKYRKQRQGDVQERRDVMAKYLSALKQISRLKERELELESKCNLYRERSRCLSGEEK
jgi:hypothetical protein